MTDATGHAELIARLRAEADEIDRSNAYLRSAGTPKGGLQRNWRREAADALESAYAKIDDLDAQLARSVIDALERAATIAESAQGPYRETRGSKALRSAIVAAIRREK